MDLSGIYEHYSSGHCSGFKPDSLYAVTAGGGITVSNRKFKQRCKCNLKVSSFSA